MRKELNIPKFNIEEAKKLIEELGVPPDQRKITWVAYGGVDVLKNVALLFQANAKKAGLEVEIVQGDWGVMWDKQKKLETSFNVYPYRNWPDYATIQPSAMLKTQKEGESLQLLLLLGSRRRRLDRRGHELEAIDKAKASEAWSKAYQKAIDDGAMVNLADTKRVITHRANLEGITTDRGLRDRLLPLPEEEGIACIYERSSRTAAPLLSCDAAMARYIAQRLILLVGTLIGVLTVTFFLTRILPGSPEAMILGRRPTRRADRGRPARARSRSAALLAVSAASSARSAKASSARAFSPTSRCCKTSASG